MIDFANVRNIVIPEGEVFSIASGAEILWRKQKYKRELLYLESTGTQHIETDIPLTSNSRFEIVAEITSKPTTGSALFGARGSSANNNNIGVAIGTGSLAIDFTNSAYSTFRAAYNVEDAVGQKLTFVGDKTMRAFYDAGGNLLASNNTVCTDDITTKGFWIFTQNGVSSSWVKANAKVYSAKDWENTELVCDLIPVLDWDDIPCLYDKVTDELFYNQGTGEFLYG